MKQLRKLGLFNTKVTDAGIKELVALPDLEELDLGLTAVTKACVPDLAKMKKLKSLNLNLSKVSILDENEVRKALPNCKVTWGE
jgi:hypothetical protein